ncbi:hypothetical protein CKF54_07755 [Psittacicella hinzii]|uniref:Uncharacterized protein n=1 Tax=Psittacicella hinzii TaxID=2028575 RepID=A0A3A1Y1H9_9GAMM|nr:hypothetical protein [Psittacicella hinzii]RIY31088.1 hypothetical protein CKF54_07755 [Psittacicella hinzii]
MKFNKTLATTLAVLATLVTVNAQASIDQMDNRYTISAKAEAQLASQEITKVNVNGQTVTARYVTDQDGFQKLVLGEVNADSKIYAVDNLLIQAPASMSVSQINASLKALNYKAQLSA